MKYKEAKAIGLECGLERPYEFINNVTIHIMNIFTYKEIQKELDELREDAKKEGISFSSVCNHAIPKDRDTDKLCYMCVKFETLNM